MARLYIAILGCAAVALTALLPCVAQADEMLPGPIPAVAQHVIDGDTLEVIAHIWPGLATRARVRLAGIDAPELSSPCPAARAKAEAARTVLANAVAGVALRLVRIRPEHAYGRILADVQLSDGSDVGELLLSVGLAKPYKARVRCDWCAAAPRCAIALK
jgi:micrococcal nuclease